MAEISMSQERHGIVAVMGECGEVTNPPGDAPTLVLAERRRNASAKETLGQLLEALVPFLAGARENAHDVLMKSRLPPPVSGRVFGVAGGTLARAFEQRRRGGRIEIRIVAGGKGEAATRPAVGVFVDESSGHG
jgi:hypothetical protein